MIYQHTNEPVLEQITVAPHERAYHKRASNNCACKPTIPTALHATDTSRDYVANEKEIAQVSDAGVRSSGNAQRRKCDRGALHGSLWMRRASRFRPIIPSLKSAYAKLPINNFIDPFAYAQFRELGFVSVRPLHRCRVPARFLSRRDWTVASAG